MPNTLKYINLATESWGLLFCMLAMAILLIATHIDRHTRRYFLAIFSLLFLDLLSNMGGLLLRGRVDIPGLLSAPSHRPRGAENDALLAHRGVERVRRCGGASCDLSIHRHFLYSGC